MTDSTAGQPESHPLRSGLLVAAAWAAVVLPLLWGVVQTLYKAALLFR